MSKLSNKALFMKLNCIKISALVAGVALFGFSSCKSESKNGGKGAGMGGRSRKVSAEAYIVKEQSFSNVYTSSGSLRPNEEIEIHPEMSGRVTNISFHEGSVVRKGQLLIQLYDADLRAQLQRLQAQKRLQQSTEKRQQELVNIGGISKLDFETTQTQIKYIDADIAAAEATLSKMRVLAPFDGIVGLRNVSVGAVISPTTVIATLQQTHPLKMDFNVPDQYRSQISVGQAVFFSVDGVKDSLSGRISAIEPGADAQTRTIRVRAIVPNPKGSLTSGGFAHVVIPFSINNNAILIPSQSIIPTTRDKKVAVVRNGVAELIVVKIGDRTSGKVEVTQGLQTGDTILTTALMQVKPGDTVNVKKVVM